MSISSNVTAAPLQKKLERQGHGFDNEELLKKRFGLTKYTDEKSNDYTSKYDAVAPDGIPVSIKTEALGSDIELGDYFRNSRITDDYYMIVSFWEGKKDNIVKNLFVLIPGTKWTTFFDSQWDDKIRKLISEASNERSYDAEWTRRRKELAAEYGTQFIRLRPKRDHKSQKRMQCAISYKEFAVFAEENKTTAFEKWDILNPLV